MFNWKNFVSDMRVVLYSPKKVSHLCYHEINIRPYGFGTLLVGAYKYSKESKEDNELIRLFKNNGVVILAIIQAIEYGLSSSEETTFDSFVAPSYFSNKEILQEAFEKGRTLQVQA